MSHNATVFCFDKKVFQRSLAVHKRILNDSLATFGTIRSLPEKYILSSGGQTGSTATGGIAVFVRDGKLGVEVSIPYTRRRWITENINTESDEWFHLAETLSITGNLTEYVNGTHLPPVTSTSYSQSGGIRSSMHFAKLNNNK